MKIRRNLMRAYLAVAALLMVGSLTWQAQDVLAVQVSQHKNAFWASANFTGDWHGGGYNEDAIDLQDPGNNCTQYSGCNTAYFRYLGQNQYYADYTLSSYYSATGCTGRAVTVRYYAGGIWKPLIRLNYVHLKNMRSSLSGTLDYAANFNDWVGDVADSQAGTCDWSGVHLHYSRSTNYGTNDHNSVSSPVGSDTVVFNSYSY